MTREPAVSAANDPRRPHLMRADWRRDGDGRGAHLSFWRTSDGRAVLQDIRSNAATRGRDMVRWRVEQGMPVTVVEVIPQTVGFWDRMLREGLIVRWVRATGWPNPLERVSTAWPEIVRTTPVRSAVRMNFRRRITRNPR